MGRIIRILPLLILTTTALPPIANAAERLCDASTENCRTPLLNLINAERVGIDVAFWFMEDSRFSSAIISRFKAGVPVRVIMDTDANVNYPLNAQILESLKAAGIPMRQKTSRGIVHWKTMLFAGQNVVQFSSANYSNHAFLPVDPYVNYIDEVIYFSDDPDVVNSFKRKFDDVWITTSGFANYANVTSLARHYPLFTLDPEMNFPPYQSFQSRSVKSYAAETVGIDSIMFRIMDRAHVDGLIAALNRGARVRLITEPQQYRDDTGSRIWHSWNVDRLYMAGKARGVVTVRHRKHAGWTHEKATVLHGQKMTIFGSSNWTTSSSSSQLEHNYFTRKPWFYEWFKANFNRKWTNAAGFAETQPFVPLPPDRPILKSPANTAQNQSTTPTLKWYGGPWAHSYDVEISTDSVNFQRVKSDLALGPSDTATDNQSVTIGGLLPGTTYYWRIVGRTVALQTKTSAAWSFRTSGTATATTSSGGTDIVLHTAAAALRGAWQLVSDAGAASGRAAVLADKARAKIATAVASPADYFELTFTAKANTTYRLWIRGRALGNNPANDSVHVQFTDSVNASGSAQWRIGTTSSMAVNLEHCSGCGIAGWGWQDNGWGSASALGATVKFATAGTKRIRVQNREDGYYIDQIVLSPSTYLSKAPGANQNSRVILPANSNGS
jgi:phosphatidylserine/phosphatidylglycerophosphate/cardiolipin synthase-like enzyme